MTDSKTAPVVKVPKRFQWNVSGECRMQLVETVPITLISHNFAEDLPVEHMSTMEVRQQSDGFDVMTRFTISKHKSVIFVAYLEHYRRRSLISLNSKLSIAVVSYFLFLPRD